MTEAVMIFINCRSKLISNFPHLIKCSFHTPLLIINVHHTFQQKQTPNANKRIIYGASTLVNSKQFLRQLTLLGQEIKDK